MYYCGKKLSNELAGRTTFFLYLNLKFETNKIRKN